MKKILIIPAFLFALCSPSAASHDDALQDEHVPEVLVTREELNDIIGFVRTNDQYKYAGQNPMTQALNDIYKRPDVQAALRAIPQLTKRADTSDRERRENYNKITGIEYEQVYQDKRIFGLEQANGIQLDLLAGLEKGVSLSIEYIEDEKSDDREYKAAVYGGVITLGTLFVAWILGKFYHMLTNRTVSAVNSDQTEE